MCGTVGQLAGSLGKVLKVKKKADYDLFTERNEGQFEEGNRYSVLPGDLCYIIASDDIETLVIARFAYEAEHQGQKRYLFNARVEGFLNKEDNPNYKGTLGIWGNPWVKKTILEKRCIIPVNFFIEGPQDKKVSRKFLIKRKDEQIFFLAGIYEDFVDKTSGEIMKHFVIITTAYNGITFAVGHHRCPLIVSEENAYKWFDLNTSKTELEGFMMPYAANEFIAYEVDPIIGKRNKGERSSNDPKMKNPIGGKIEPLDI